MAERRARARAAVRRSGRHEARAAAQTGSDIESKNNSVRSTVAKQGPALFPDLKNGTPRIILKRVMQNQPQVSPLALQISNHEDMEEAHSEVPHKRVSSMGELQLPDVAPEDTSVTVFHMKKKRKKFSISEFERAAERRLLQNQAQSALDSTITTRSIRMSVGSLMAPDTVEKRGLLRRPKNRKAVDMQAFEGRVEQNLLKSKGQNYLVDSQSASGIRTSILTSDAEVMMNSTELFVQSQLDEQSQDKLSALEPQLSASETSAQRSQISDADQVEARPEGLVPSVGTNEGRTQTYSKNLSLDHKHVDKMTRVSPETPAKRQEDQQDHSQQSNPMAQVSLSEEQVVGTVYSWSSSLPSRSSSKHLGSPVTVNPSSMSLREVVSHIIEKLELCDTEEEMVNTVNGEKQEKIFREAAKHGVIAGDSEHLEKKMAEKAELPKIAAQDSRGETEMAPSAGEELAEGSVGAHGSPRAEHEIARGIGSEHLDRQSHAFSSFGKPGTTPLNEDDDQEDQVEDQAIMLELDNSVEQPDEDETEQPASQEVKKIKSEVRQCRLDSEDTAMGSSQERTEVSMKTPAFVRVPAYNPLLSTPRVAKPAAPSSSQRSPLKLLKCKTVPKRLGTSQRKPCEPQLPRSLIKEIFSHFVKMPVTRDAFKIVEKCSERYFKQLSNDLEAYANHAGRKTVEMADLEVLMRRQGLVTDKMPLHVLIERYLPLEYRKLLIPIAVSGNKVIPCK